MRKILTLGLCLGLIGCATLQQREQEPNTCIFIADSYFPLASYWSYKDYEIEIISDPPGAKIEWDNEYIGVTPLKKIMNGIRTWRKEIIVKAYPTLPGQYVQIKYLYENPLPRKIYFDMNLRPTMPLIDVHIRNNRE